MKYIKLSDVVDELSALRREHDRLEWLTYMISAKSALKDHKIIYLNDFKRVFLVVDQATMTVRIPDDYYRFRTISVLQDCLDRYGRPNQKVIPLTLNPYINITPETDPIDACKPECGCQVTHPVCVELASYTTICEDVLLEESPPIYGVKQTVIRTCSNGDIMKEVSQPMEQFIQGAMVCDYTIEVADKRTVCSYDLEFELEVIAAFTFTVSFQLNGATITSGTLSSYAEIQAFFEGYGWTAITDRHYTLSNTTDVYSDTITFTYYTGTTQVFSSGRHCMESNAITFPYTIVSYNINGVVNTESPPLVIANQTEQDDFFFSLGFTKVDDTHYKLEGSADVHFNMVIETDNLVCDYGIDFSEFDFSAYPYTISITADGQGITSALLTNDDELFGFFEQIGFALGGIGMELLNSNIDFGNIFTQNVSPPIEFSTHRSCTGETTTHTLNFVQSNCVRPMISNGIKSILSSDILCKVDLKKCGCIPETPANITKIVECCAPYLHCCQTGELSNWAGWGYVPSCCPTNTPQPYNLKGTYNLDEHNYKISLDSVLASKVLLAYDDDGSCNGEYLLPEYCMDSMKAGVAFYHAQYNEEITDRRRRELEINYSKMLGKLERYHTDPIRMADLVEALKSKSVL